MAVEVSRRTTNPALKIITKSPKLHMGWITTVKGWMQQFELFYHDWDQTPNLLFVEGFFGLQKNFRL